MKWSITAVALGLAMPAAARDLAVPTDKGWKHAETGLVLMPQLAGMSRTALTDATQTEHDVAAQYDTRDKSTFATIYLFRPAIADVSLWFDRSQTALETRDLFKNASPATADPITFAVGGAKTASSMRQVYATPVGQYRSAALLVGCSLRTFAIPLRRLYFRLSSVSLLQSDYWSFASSERGSVGKPVLH